MILNQISSPAHSDAMKDATVTTKDIFWGKTAYNSKCKCITGNAPIAGGDKNIYALLSDKMKIKYNDTTYEFVKDSNKPSFECTSDTFTTGDWSSICYGNGKFVAVERGSQRSIYSLDMGNTWEISQLPKSATWSLTCYGDNKFVAIAYGSTDAAYSTDGITWTATTLPETGKWCSICYGDGKFVLSATDKTSVAYSTDGITWQTTNESKGGYICYGDGKFVTVLPQTNVAAYSTDGITWTATTLPETGRWSSIAYGNGMFVASISGSTTMAYSTDGITWTKVEIENKSSNAEWYNVYFIDNKFVRFYYNSMGEYVAYSQDGITWEYMLNPVFKAWNNGDVNFFPINFDGSDRLICQFDDKLFSVPTGKSMTVFGDYHQTMIAKASGGLSLSIVNG